MFRERDGIAARRPYRRRIGAAAEADALRHSAAGGHHVDLLRAAAIGFKTDLRAVGRIARRRIDRRRVGQPCHRLGAQVHHEQVGIAALLQAHDDPLTVRREPRREAHAREIADDLPLSGLDVEEINTRVALPVGHVRDFLRRSCQFPAS